MNRLAGWAVWMLIAGSLLSSLRVSQNEHASRTCSDARYVALVANLRIGRQVSTRSDAAKSQVFAGVTRLAVHPGVTPDEKARDANTYRDLLEQYASAQEQVDAYRAANPYPDLDSPCTHKR